MTFDFWSASFYIFGVVIIEFLIGVVIYFDVFG